MHNIPALTEIDKKILDIIQQDFPLASRPYAVLAEKLGLTEEEVLARVRRMRANGVIRRLGANFQSHRLGFFSTLCAATVPPEKFDAFVERVNQEKGVTHNYERNHPWNVWFTLIAPGREAAAEILAAIEKDTGVAILNLPATRLFKINVNFAME